MAKSDKIGIGIGVGVVILIIIIVLAVIFWKKRKLSKKKKKGGDHVFKSLPMDEENKDSEKVIEPDSAEKKALST